MLPRCKYEIFSFVNWPHDQKVTWLLSWGPLIAGYNSFKLGSHRHCRNPDIRFYICLVTTPSKGHVTWWMLSSALNHEPLSFGVSLSYCKEDVIFPIPVPIPIPISMFANYQIQPEPSAFESFSFCKSIQNKDQISIFKFIFHWPYI